LHSLLWRGDGETRDSRCCAKNLVADAKTKMSKKTLGLEFKLFYGDNEAHGCTPSK
jgi:hypothetical protein